MQLNMKYCQVFAAVVEHGGFHQAAQAIHISQPAITNTIHKLEAQIGFACFSREGHRATLTEKGEYFYQRCRRLLDQAEKLNEFTSQLSQGVEAEIKIAVDIIFPYEKLVTFFDSIVNQFPNTHFHFYHEALGGATERLLNQDVDIAITECLCSRDSVTTIPLAEIELIPVASQRFIEKNKEKLYDPQRIYECMQIIIRDSSRHQPAHSFAVIEHARHWTVGDMITKKLIIESGFGWGHLPSYLVNFDSENQILKRLVGEHFPKRVCRLEAMRLKDKPIGPVASELWSGLMTMS